MKKDTIGYTQAKRLQLTMAQIFELASKIENPEATIFVPRIPETQRSHYKKRPDGTIRTNLTYF